MLTPIGLAFLANKAKSACWLDIKISISIANVETTSTSFTSYNLLLGSLSINQWQLFIVMSSKSWNAYSSFLPIKAPPATASIIVRVYPSKPL